MKFEKLTPERIENKESYPELHERIGDIDIEVEWNAGDDMWHKKNRIAGIKITGSKPEDLRFDGMPLRVGARDKSIMEEAFNYAVELAQAGLRPQEISKKVGRWLGSHDKE